MELPEEFTVTITTDHVNAGQMALLRGGARRTQVCVIAQAVKPVIPDSWVDSRGRVHHEVDWLSEEVASHNIWADGAQVERIVDLFDNRKYAECRAMLPMTVTFKKIR